MKWTSARKFLILCVLSLLSEAALAVDLDQGWSPSQQTNWYESTQGSRLIPLAWIQALEQKDSTQSFLADQNLLRFGYVPRTLSRSKIRLPRGFVIDTSDDTHLAHTHLRWKSGQSSSQPWVGITCAACHTATISYSGTVLTVLGGPTQADFQSFFDSFDGALEQTAQDPAKFARFASSVLKQEDSAQNRALLSSALSDLIKRESQTASLNQTELRYGFGRLDAVGHILNQVQVLTGIASPPQQPADAPVSYPFLWNVPQQDKLQWNGMAANHRVRAIHGQNVDIGALGRNAGELTGVFGDIAVVKNPGALGGYTSSLDTRNLVGLEDQLRHLRPPRWPSELFGAPDSQAVARGKQLFDQTCKECHAVAARTDLASPMTATMVKLVQDGSKAPIGTDIWMACNAWYSHGPTGLFQGLIEVNGSGAVGSDDKLANLLAVNVKRVLLGKKYDIAQLVFIGFFGAEPTPQPVKPEFEDVLKGFHGVPPTEKQIREKVCTSTNDPLLAYKGRSLNGIWATAPYLHNGSVPTLWDLLLAPEQRPKTFKTGSTEFDPNKVGFKPADDADNPFVFDTSRPGNSNLGHDYGTGQLSDEDRQAIVEYLKTL
jgi:cytochrome c553